MASVWQQQATFVIRNLTLFAILAMYFWGTFCHFLATFGGGLPDKGKLLNLIFFISAHYGLSLAAAGNLCNQSNGASSSNSTPYSQISVPSSYDYEDDFTSESDSEIPAYLPTAQGPPQTSNSLPHASSDKR